MGPSGRGAVRPPHNRELMTQEMGLCKGAAGQEGRKHPLGFGSTIGPGREPLGEAS